MASGYVDVSPLQMKLLLFEKVHVEARYAPDQSDKQWAPNFEFQDTPIALDVSVAEKPGKVDGESTREYRVAVQLRVYEDPESSQNPPYSVDVSANAWFHVDPRYKSDQCLTLVEVNGASLVIGAIREEVARVTSRSHLGTLTLPTLRVVPSKNDKEEVAHNTK